MARTILVKNTTGATITTDSGLSIEASDEANLSYNFSMDLENDALFENYINNGSLVINDGVADLTPSQALEYVKVINQKYISEIDIDDILQLGNSTNQAVNGTNPVVITWDIEDLTSGSAISHSTTTNPEIITINTDGRYEIYSRLCDDNTQNNIVLYVQLQRQAAGDTSFSDVPRFLGLGNTSTAPGDGTSISGMIELNTGDQIRIVGYFSSAGANGFFLANSCQLSVKRIQNLSNVLSPNAFETIVSSGDDVVATSGTDTLTITSGNSILTVIGNGTTKTLNFSVDQSQIDHNALINTHNLTTDIDHNQLTNYDPNVHFTMASIDHGSISGLDDDDHGAVYPGLSQIESITGDWDFSTGTLRIPNGAGPPSSGQNEANIFWSTSDSTFYIYDGSTWKGIDPAITDLPAVQIRRAPVAAYPTAVATADFTLLDVESNSSVLEFDSVNHSILVHQTGFYRITYYLDVGDAPGGSYPTVYARVMFNGVELPGSRGMTGTLTYTATINMVNSLSYSFIAELSATGSISLEWYCDTASVPGVNDSILTITKLDGIQGPQGLSGNTFDTINCPAGTNPVANGEETLTLTSGNNILTLTGNSSTDTVDFTINQNNIDHGSISGLNDDDHGAIYPGLNQTESITGLWTFGAAGSTDPNISIVPKTSIPSTNLADGSICYHNNMLYYYDSSRSKWLSIEGYFIGAGRNGNQGTGYLRAFNGMAMADYNGWVMPFDGTVVSLHISKSDSGPSTVYIRENGADIASLAYATSTGTEQEYDTTINANFSAGSVLSFYTSGSTTNNPIVWARIKWRL